jgi:hypothetical protein
MKLIVDKQIDFVFFCEPFDKTFLVLSDALDKIACNTDVESAIRLLASM